MSPQEIVLRRERLAGYACPPRMSLEHRLHARCACSALSAPHFVLAGTERQYERSRPFLVRHLMLDLELHIAKKSVSGAATLDFERIAPDETEMILDAIGFSIERVRIDTGDGLSDARSLTATDLRHIRRAWQPASCWWFTKRRRAADDFLEPDEHVKDRPRQVWSQCQDEDARHIFPCHDKPHVKQTTSSVDVPETSPCCRTATWWRARGRRAEVGVALQLSQCTRAAW
jgi:aminopeptidase N